MSDNQSHYTLSDQETATPPPSRNGSDLLEASVQDLNEFQVTSHDKFTKTNTGDSDSDSENFDEKVLDTATFEWKAFDVTEEKLEVTEVNEVTEVTLSEVNLTEDEYADMPPLIDSDYESGDCKSTNCKSTNCKSDDCESEDGNESNTSEVEESEDEELVRPVQNEESPLLIRVLLLLFLFLHLINHAMLLKDKSDRTQTPCFPFHY